MKQLTKICVVFVLLLITSGAFANTTASSTIWFYGENVLTTYDAGGVTGWYGTINAIEGTYYAIGGPGTTWDAVDNRWETPDGQAAVGGFDVYAKEGGTAYVTDYYGATGGDVGSYVIGSDHDAYPGEHDGGPWGAWYNPDVADWQQYSLELTTDHWYLRYTPTGESPMSGSLVWIGEGVGYAYETDLGTQYGGHDGSATYGGGAGYWDWDCGWGIEAIPLQCGTFKINVEGITCWVSLTPIPAPGAILLGGIGVGLVGWLRRRGTL